ncbi:VOC family protein [Brevundimonas sp.]|uniref:VOC family protein n=1 Tax=Brevundimonas sp. TaxID=1871086 RepID=UPI002FCC8B0A
MQRLIFINLPVHNLAKSVTFYESVGGQKNPMFSDHTAACMVFSDTIHAMLLTHEKFSSFTERAIPDAHKTAQVLICISAENKAEVDRLAEAADTHGGIADPNPAIEFPFMYSRSFADPDGHIWEVMWMDPASIPSTPDAFEG